MVRTCGSGALLALVAGGGGGGEVQRGSDCSTAGQIDLDSPDGATGVLEVMGDRDFFQFEGLAHEWIEIDYEPIGNYHQVYVLLYNGAHLQIAHADGALRTRLPTDG